MYFKNELIKFIKYVMQHNRAEDNGFTRLHCCKSVKEVINCKRTRERENIIVLAVEQQKSIIKAAECTQNG